MFYFTDSVLVLIKVKVSVLVQVKLLYLEKTTAA